MKVEKEGDGFALIPENRWEADALQQMDGRKFNCTMLKGYKAGVATDERLRFAVISGE